MVEIIVPIESSGQRLDHFLVKADIDPPMTRTRLQALILEGHCVINDAVIKTRSHTLKGGEVITLTIPEATDPLPQPQKMDLEIVYEDEHLLVLNKAAGVVVHPAPGHYDSTIVHGLLYHCGDTLSGIGGVKRPGIVHRLDKETSGLMVVAKTDPAHQGLMEQFQDHSLSRTYWAFVWGVLNPLKGTLEDHMGRSRQNRQKMSILQHSGKHAITHYATLKLYAAGFISLVECTLETGRTHQIRLHMASLGHPVLNDPLYGRTPTGALTRFGGSLPLAPHRQALHAKKLRFIHPISKDEMTFEVDLPKDMQALMEQIEGL